MEDPGKKFGIVNDLSTVSLDITILKMRGNSKGLEHLQRFHSLSKIEIFKINQKDFDRVVPLLKAKQVRLMQIMVPDLHALEQLADVEELELEWNTKATKLWNIDANPNLRALTIRDFPKLRDISALQSTTLLDELTLSGGLWKSLDLDTLQPLSHQTQLKQLNLGNMRVTDQSLQPLENLHQLMSLWISNQFPTEEYARLSVRLPNAVCERFQPYVKMRMSINNKDVLVTGQRKPFLSTIDNKDKLKAYVQNFKKLQDKYRK